MPKILDDCVARLKAKGKAQGSAFAICTATLQSSGALQPGTQKLKRNTVLTKGK